MTLSELVDPGHAVVGRILAKVGGAVGTPGLLDALRDEFAGWKFASRAGPSPYEQVEAAREGNCIDLASLFCAALRRAGQRSSHVLLGSWRGAFPAVLHAWVLVRGSEAGTWLLIDPAGMRVRECQADEIEHDLTVVAVFDDLRIIISRADRDRLLRSYAGEGEEAHVRQG